MGQLVAPICWQGVPIDLSTAEGRLRLSELKAAIVRMTNCGVHLTVIADKLALSQDDAVRVLDDALRELVAPDAIAVRGRQQAMLNDIRASLYPSLESPAFLERDGAAKTLLKVADHEAKIHGVHQATKILVGMDHETFTTTAAEDIRELGFDPAGSTVLEPEDGTWANT